MEHLLKDLNQVQREAVLYNEGPSLVIAGAGSGKTRVLTYKIAGLLEQGFPPYSILALTFTNKAAKEMKERISKMVGQERASKLWMGTFHSIFSTIIRIEAEKIGYNSNYTVYDSADSKNLIKAIVKEMGLDDKEYKPNVVASRISRAKNALVSSRSYHLRGDYMEADKYSRIPRVYEIYQQYDVRLKQSNAMDFDDLLFNTNVLFRDHPDILAKYQEKFRFILVDEYQDTNFSQHLIIKKLAEIHQRVCVVGDDAQSIYSFRGANIQNILSFQQTYPQGKLFKLEENYRSTQNIVGAANSIIARNKNQIKKEVFSSHPEGDKIEVMAAYSDLEEGYLIANKIAQVRMTHHNDLNEFAVLYRTNAQSRIMEEALRKRSIPYKIYGGLSFYQRKEIKDIIGYFKLLINPNDEEALKRVINYPARGIGDTTVGKIIACARTHSVGVWDIVSSPLTYALDVNGGTAKKLQLFKEIIERLQNLSSAVPAYELAEELVLSTGIKTTIYQDNTPEGVSRQENITELLGGIREFCKNKQEEEGGEASLTQFLAEVSLLTDMDETQGEQESKVTLMTIHAAKGLEFANVFIVGVEENLFPGERAVTTESEIEEERRLFYVAVTRAKERCFISYAKSRFKNGTSSSMLPSRFIEEIDPKYVDLPSDITVRQKMFSSHESKAVFYGASSQERKLSRISSSDSAGHSSSGPLFQKRQTQVPEQRAAGAEFSPVESIGDLKAGMRILHDRFGNGEILMLEGSGDNAKATVRFDQAGEKKLLLKYARLQIIG